MKLAEALLERKSLVQKIETLHPAWRKMRWSRKAISRPNSRRR